jgi:tripartite-type tricarboxylate transporter receptor subunit TctC
MKMKPSLFKAKTSFFLYLVLSLLFTASGYSQEAEIAKFPSRPITYITPLPPGGPTDVAIRLISKEAEKYLGQPIVIVNKPGGATSIGIAAIATAKPDGYTIGYTAHSGMFVVPFLEKIPYHPIRDLKPIMQFGGFNFGVIVKADSPFKSFHDLIAYARQNPKKVTYGTSGTNSMQYIIMEQIAKKEKVQITHIPFKGTPESQTALLGGHILCGAGDFNYSLLEAGQIRLLLLLKDERSAEYPKTPIIKDLGYDIPCPMTLNVFGPKGIPDGIAKKIEDAYTQAMKEPTFIKGMKEDLLLPVVHRNHKELDDYINYNYEVYVKVLKEMGLTK